MQIVLTNDISLFYWQHNNNPASGPLSRTILVPDKTFIHSHLVGFIQYLSLTFFIYCEP